VGRPGRRSEQASGFEEGEGASCLLRNKVLPASEQFDPETYLRVIHTASSPVPRKLTGLPASTNDMLGSPIVLDHAC
jgi:hypothetical protein